MADQRPTATCRIPSEISQHLAAGFLEFGTQLDKQASPMCELASSCRRRIGHNPQAFAKADRYISVLRSSDIRVNDALVTAKQVHKDVKTSHPSPLKKAVAQLDQNVPGAPAQAPCNLTRVEQDAL